MKTRIISLVNHKGGVGKTTSTLNLGKALTLLGKKVLLIDIDPQANLSLWCNIREPKPSIYESLTENIELPITKLSENLHIVPANLNLASADVKLHSGVGGYFRLKKNIKPLIDLYDFILIDCPPSLSILTINALIASNEILIVVQSQFLSIEGLKTIYELLDELKDNLESELFVTGLLLTQTNHTIISRNVVEMVENMYKNKVFKTQIKQSVKLIESSAERKDIFDYDSKCSGATDYTNLANEILNNGK